MTETPPRPLETPPPSGDARLDALARLLAIVDRLREPDGCPWDREQTVRSMAPSFIEEAHELVEAIEAGDEAGTIEEGGDLLMVLSLVARIGSEDARFDLGTLAQAVGDKLLRRHPHVFGDVTVDGTAEVLANWERIKQAERREKGTDASALAGVPTALPALQRADRLAAKAISAGFRWTATAGAFEKLREEVEELTEAMRGGDAARIESELGDVCLAAAFLGTYLKVDPERATRAALRRFEARFRHMEQASATPLSEQSLEELVAAWGEAKRAVDEAGESLPRT